MSHRPSNILSSSQARAIARRKAAAAAPVYAISFDAAANLVQREVEKAGRIWWRVQDQDGSSAFMNVANEVQQLADSRKHARQLVLARLDRFPLVQA